MIIIDNERIGAAIVRDITERKLEEEERRQVELTSERDKRRFYRETILAVTGGKFELTEPEEASKWIENPQFTAHISGPEVLAQVRQDIINFCINKGLSEDNAYEFELGIGEALANAVKHAKGGDVYAGTRDDIVWVAIVDHGTGIDTFTLPKVALLLGFSTKASMGLGYTMILAVSDHVKLATGPGGTTILMEKRLTPVGDIDRRIAVHQGIK